ncbi:hypothetical protein GCM10009128_27560 [Psychrosphaera haliotis]|uniref:GNAT family N-acetyltransferase n=1 Tax=Psychrosphaera haliotis TaxID=555083 RepID=UPI0031CE533D
MTEFIDYIAQLKQKLSQQKQRGIVRLVGSVSQCYECVYPLIECSLDSSPQGIEHLKIIPFLEPESLSADSVLRKNEWRIKKFRKYLGQECDILIYDAYQGFNADAVAALSGVIKQGGVLILITPPDAKWLAFQDPEQSRFISEKVNVSDIDNNFISHLLSVFENNSNNGVYLYNADKGIADDSLDLTSENNSQKASQRTSQIIQEPTSGGVPNSVTNDVSNGSAEVSFHEYEKSKSDTYKNDNAKKDSPYLTTDQDRVAISITDLLNTKPINSESLNKPDNDIDKSKLQDCLLITADRGRGKSSVIGIAVAQWLNQLSVDRPFNIVVTSSSLDSTGILTEHFSRLLRVTNPTIKFCSPDHIINQSEDFKNNIDLLIIDEAASLPVTVVKELVGLTGKAILATTIHGYEGTGRGFEYKLKPWLKDSFNNYKHEMLTQPVRWTENDDLERIVNQGICFIKEESSPISNTVIQSQVNGAIVSGSAEQRTFIKLSAKQLLQTGQIADVFGLLTEAHYQTSPNDLRAMLDNPDMEIFGLFEDNELIATALISLEGGFEPELDGNLMGDIQKGIRRPRGHLFPQSLLAHCGYANAGYFKYARVVRIAVTPSMQSQGLGSELLANIKSYYESSSAIDFLCTSFGFDIQVLNFWINNAFSPVRLGLKADTSTGLVSIFMAKALNSDAETSLELWQQRCIETINTELETGQRKSQQDAVYLLIQAFEASPPAGYSIWSKNQNWLDLNHLGSYHRSPDSCFFAVQSIFRETLNKPFELLEDKFLNGLSNKELIVNYQCTGEKELVKNIRNQMVKLLNTYVEGLKS